MMKRWYMCTAFAFAMAGVAEGQQGSSVDFRRSSNRGAYPAYLGVGWTTGTSNVLEFQRITAEGGLSDQFSEAGGKVKLRGVDLKAGFVIARGRPFLERWRTPAWMKPPNIIVEADYQNIYKDFDPGVTGTLITRLELGSLRLGVRYNLFYPVVFQLTTGPILYHSASIRINRTDQPPDGLYAQAKSKTLVEYTGWDTRARFSFFDGAGTAGGLGAFVEVQYLAFSMGTKVNWEPLYGAVDRPDYSTTPNVHSIACSIGITAPLALPFK